MEWSTPRCGTALAMAGYITTATAHTVRIWGCSLRAVQWVEVVWACKDFTLKVDWRIKETPWKNPRVPIILPTGLHKLDENGEEIRIIVPDSDSGILYRGPEGDQANIWCWPTGSGEVYGYRMNKDMPPEVRAGVTPKVNADKNIGETFHAVCLRNPQARV